VVGNNEWHDAVIPPSPPTFRELAACVCGPFRSRQSLACSRTPSWLRKHQVSRACLTWSRRLPHVSQWGHYDVRSEQDQHSSMTSGRNWPITLPTMRILGSQGLEGLRWFGMLRCHRVMSSRLTGNDCVESTWRDQGAAWARIVLIQWSTLKDNEGWTRSEKGKSLAGMIGGPIRYGSQTTRQEV